MKQSNGIVKRENKKYWARGPNLGRYFRVTREIISPEFEIYREIQFILYRLKQGSLSSYLNHISKSIENEFVSCDSLFGINSNHSKGRNAQ